MEDSIIVNKDSFEYFDKNYKAMFFLLQKNNGANIKVNGSYYGEEIKKQNLFLSHTPRHCRFCNSVEPQTTFTKKEHIIAESIGNKSFISKGYECDKCNAYFSLLENDLNNFLKALLTLNQIPGKNGIKSYKSFDKTSRIDSVDNKIVISEQVDNKKVSVDLLKHELSYKFDFPKYSPQNLYKIICKMALSFMLPDDFKDYDLLANYLRTEKNSVLGFETILFSFYPKCNFDLTVLGYKRKKEVSCVEIPTFQFLVMNSNFSLQIPLYSNKEISKIKSHPKMYSIPTPFDYQSNGEKIKMTQEIVVKDSLEVEKHTETCSLHFDDIKESNIKDAQIYFDKIYDKNKVKNI